MNDTELLNGLRKLCGYVQDSSQTTITISQDDATKAWILRWGTGPTQWAWGGSLREVIRNAIRDDQNRALFNPAQ